MKEKIDQKLDEALRSEIEFSLPADFALKLVANIEAISAKSDRRLKWILGIIIAFTSLIGLLVVVTLSTPESLSAIGEYMGWIILVPVSYALVQYFDNKLVKQRMHI